MIRIKLTETITEGGKNISFSPASGEAVGVGFDVPADASPDDYYDQAHQSISEALGVDYVPRSDFDRYYEGTISRADYSTKILATWRAMNLVEVKKGDLLFADLESFSRSAQVLDVIALVRAMDYKGAEAKINGFTHKISTSERKAAWIKAMGEVVG
jgi:hypothetical protein